MEVKKIVPQKIIRKVIDHGLHCDRQYNKKAECSCVIPKYKETVGMPTTFDLSEPKGNKFHILIKNDSSWLYSYHLNYLLEQFNHDLSIIKMVFEKDALRISIRNGDYITTEFVEL